MRLAGAITTEWVIVSDELAAGVRRMLADANQRGVAVELRHRPVARSLEEAAELLANLKGYELPVESKQLLLEWHEAERRYDLAENVLFELMEDDVLTKADSDDFYSRLLLLPEESLEAGGLPRDEVIEGLKTAARLE